MFSATCLELELIDFHRNQFRPDPNIRSCQIPTNKLRSRRWKFIIQILNWNDIISCIWFTIYAFILTLYTYMYFVFVLFTYVCSSDQLKLNSSFGVHICLFLLGAWIFSSSMYQNYNFISDVLTYENTFLW